MIKPKKPYRSLQPVTINEGFICENCGKPNPKAQKTCRNHCKHCLYSKHVDEKTPGDRVSHCHGLMEPSFIDYSSGKGYRIIHKCLRCGKEIANKTTDDDNIEKITEIMRRQNLQTVPHRKKNG